MRTDKKDRGFRFALSSLFPSLRGGMSMLAVATVLGFGGMTAQAAVVMGPDNFETGTNTHYTPNNNGTEWAVNTTSEVANDFYSRAAATTAWSDAPSSSTFGDVGVEAMVRIYTDDPEYKTLRVPLIISDGAPKKLVDHNVEHAGGTR